jgi:hypothetical protein
MTQDQGQAEGTGYAGDEIPDNGTEAAQADNPGPMTRLRKVASALRGDRPDQTDSDQAASAGPDTQDPNGPWPTSQREADAGSGTALGETVDDGEYADATRPDEVGAVQSPEAGNRDYWDDELDARKTAPDEAVLVDEVVVMTDPAADSADAGTGAPASGPGEMAGETRPDFGDAQDPSMTRSDAYGTAAPADTGAATAPYEGSPAAGYGDQAGTTPGYGSEAGTGTGYVNQGGTVTDPRGTPDAGPTTAGVGAAGVGAAGVGSTPTGKHAAAEDAGDAGLRPGEATERLGDFGDIAFGNLLPDAEQYTAQWQQIQYRFVDDPQGSVTEAADVISQVTTRLEAAIEERKRAIEERQRAIQERASALRGRWGEGSDADTETLRETLRMYRAFMDQLIGTTR